MQQIEGGVKRGIKIFKVNNGGERIDGEELWGRGGRKV
jgi:hypothetical protein